MPYRFTVIAHSDHLVQAVRKECRYPDVELTFRMADFDTAGPLAKQALDDGAEIVLCHGGTGRCVNRVCAHSVVTIERTELDAVRTIRAGGMVGREVIYAAHDGERLDFAAIEDLGRVSLKVVTYPDADYLFARVRELYQQGVRSLIGGGVSKRYMESLGGEGHVISLSGHSIRTALAQARSLAAHKRLEQGHYQDMLAIFRHMEEGILCVDQAGKPVFTNDSGRRLLGILDESCIPRLQAAVDSFGLLQTVQTGKIRSNTVVEVDGESLLTTCIPFTGNEGRWGAAAFFRDVGSVQKASRKVREALRCRGMIARYNLEDIAGESGPVTQMRSLIGRYAPTDAAVFIGGETGVGKELAAHALHANSPRRDAPFVAINCAALPRSLLESELFGYEEGAFTGARKGGKPGLFELAQRGTLFLDEVGEMSLETQLRLLRVLESKDVMRLGGNRFCPVDIRFVSASNRNLRQQVEEGKFRLDLFYRLTTLKLSVPPLRSRIDDYPHLIRPLLKRYRKEISCFDGEVDDMIRCYAWPGNIRELLAVSETYLLLLEEDRPNATLFGRLIQENQPPQVAVGLVEANCIGPGMLKAQERARRRQAALSAVQQAGGNKTAAARSLGVSASTLWRMLRQ